MLDLTLLQESIPDNEPRLHAVLAQFVEVARQTLTEIERITTETNAGELGDLAHRLKSSSLTAGAYALADSSQSLEDACRSADTQSITALKRNVHAEFKRAAETIAQRIAPGGMQGD